MKSKEITTLPEKDLDLSSKKLSQNPQSNTLDQYQSLLSSMKNRNNIEITELKQQIQILKTQEKKYTDEIYRLNKQHQEDLNNFVLNTDRSVDQHLNTQIKNKVISPLWDIVNCSKW